MPVLVQREGPLAVSLTVGLLWITALDALAWSRNVFCERLALAQVILFCILAIVLATKGLFSDNTGPEKVPVEGPQQGTQYAAFAEQDQLLAERYTALLHAVINETISRQIMAKALRQRRLQVERAVLNSVVAVKTVTAWPEVHKRPINGVFNQLAFRCWTLKHGDEPGF